VTHAGIERPLGSILLEAGKEGAYRRLVDPRGRGRSEKFDNSPTLLQLHVSLKSFCFLVSLQENWR